MHKTDVINYVILNESNNLFNEDFKLRQFDYKVKFPFEMQL